MARQRRERRTDLSFFPPGGEEGRGPQMSVIAPSGNPNSGDAPEGFERRPSRMPLVLLGVIVLGVFFAVGYTMFTRSVVYYHTPTEVLAMPGERRPALRHRRGRHDPNRRDRGTVDLRRDRRDLDGPDPVPRARAPTRCEDGGEAVVEGALGADGVFHADTLFAKCPSKFAGQDAGERDVDALPRARDPPSGGLEGVREPARARPASTSTCAQGSYVAVMGANGAGKTTLLKIISRPRRPDRGQRDDRRRRDAQGRPEAAGARRRRLARDDALRRPHRRENLRFHAQALRRSRSRRRRSSARPSASTCTTCSTSRSALSPAAPGNGSRSPARCCTTPP